MIATKTNREIHLHHGTTSSCNRLEALEPRLLLSSTLFITAPGVALDTTHFHSVQDALAVALPGDTLVLQSGFSPGASAIIIDEAITLTADPGVVLPVDLELSAGTSGANLTGLTLASSSTLTLDAGATGNSILGCTIPNLVLQPGSHDNQFTANSIGSLVASGDASSSGGDVFQINNFTGPVHITGNSAAATNDTFSNNTFTVSTGNALTLINADGTLVENNTFSVSQNFANGIVVADSLNVVLGDNSISTTGQGGSGIYAYTDGSNTSVDIDGNTISTGSGSGIYLAKWDSSATFEACVQGNALGGNSIGIMIYGDGSSAGNIDLGGGSTSFGSSAGGNDFSSFSSASSVSYAIGLAGTDAAFTVSAKNNMWSLADPNSAIADGTHDPAAGASGIIDTGVVSETLTLSVNPLTAIQTATVNGVVAHFSSNLVDTLDDFSVMIDWGDGSSSGGTVVNNPKGGFDVVAAHSWATAGNFTLSVSVESDEGGSALVAGEVAVTPRILTSSGVTLSVKKGTVFSGTVASFTDALPGTLPANYAVTVTWSDGLVTAGTISKNGNGSFSVKTTRTFSQAGKFTAAIAVQTLDTLFATDTTTSVTVTNGSDKAHVWLDKWHRLCIFVPRSFVQAVDQCVHQCGLSILAWAQQKQPPKPHACIPPAPSHANGR